MNVFASTPANIARCRSFLTVVAAPLVEELLSAEVFAKQERARVNSYVAPIFARYTFPVSEEFRTQPGEMVKRPSDLYLCSDEELCGEYYEDVRDAHAANGWTGPREQCPAAVAESALVKAENALIKRFAEQFGLPATSIYGKHREEVIALMKAGVAM